MSKLQREQLASHEAKVAQLEESLREHAHKSTPTKGLSLQNYVEKDNYLQFEVRWHSNIFKIVMTNDEWISGFYFSWSDTKHMCMF